MEGTCKIQILLATYNGEKYLRDQLDSLVAQTYTDWECLICDDCSNDLTLEILEEYCKADDRFKIASKGKRYGSASYSFLHLMSISDADFVLFCDQDDVWLPNKVEVLARRIIEESKGYTNIPICVFSDACIADENLIEHKNPSFQGTLKYDASDISLIELLSSNVVQGCSSVINRCLVNIVVQSSDFRYFLVFDWMLGAIAKSQGKLIYIPEMLFKYRQHGNNSIGLARQSFASWIIEQFRGLKSGDTYESFMQTSFVVSRCRRILREYPPKNYAERSQLQMISKFFDLSSIGRFRLLCQFKWFGVKFRYKIHLLKLCFTKIDW